MLLWLKSSDTNNTKICAYYGRPEAGNSFYLIIFGHVHPNKQRWDRLSVGNAGGRDEPVGKTFIVDGKWHHAALVYDGRSTTRLYVDGNQDLVFNRRYSTTLPGQGFLGDSYKGVLDEIIIVNRALSQEEVKGVYEAQKLRFANTTFESINSLGTK